MIPQVFIRLIAGAAILYIVDYFFNRLEFKPGRRKLFDLIVIILVFLWIFFGSYLGLYPA